MIKIIHIITGLGSGGAENMLYKLLKYSDKEKYYHEVISLTDEGVMGDKIRNEGVKVYSLNISKTNLISSLFKAKMICKDFDIIDTWLYHADFIGFMIAKILLKKKLIWNIRHSNLDKEVNKKTTLKIVKINSMLSNKVDGITYNSTRAIENHLSEGYKNANALIIPNGFELDKYSFDSDKRNSIRKTLGLDMEQKVFITVGRWDIQKDYFTLLKALNEVKEKKYNFHMLMVGTNLDRYNEILKDLINKYDLQENIILLGRKNNISELLSAADCYISSSLGESFSNSIGEAMACELPCIVTDVGDSKFIIGDTGEVIQPNSPSELAESIVKVLDDIKGTRNIAARSRIIKNYDINVIVKYFESFYKTVLD